MMMMMMFFLLSHVHHSRLDFTSEFSHPPRLNRLCSDGNFNLPTSRCFRDVTLWNLQDLDFVR